MRSTTFFLAAVAVSNWAAVMSLPLGSSRDLTADDNQYATRSSRDPAEMDDEDAVDLPKFDNSDYLPTQTDTPAQILSQPKPIPTLYLMSFGRSSNPDEESRRSKWLSFQQARSAPTGTGQPDRDDLDLPTYDNPDVVVIAMFAAFFLLATFIEMRHRAAVAASEAKCKVGLVIGLPGQLRLEGAEKRLLPDSEEDFARDLPSPASEKVVHPSSR